MIQAHLVKRRRGRGGKVRESRGWYVRYKLPGEQRYKLHKLNVRDKQVAQQRLSEFVHQQEWELSGIVAPRGLREGAARKLSDHLADFVAELRRLGRAAMYAYNVEKRVNKVITGCGWELPKDVTAETFIAWRQKQTAKPKTLNDHLDAVLGLLNWMKRNGRISGNPLLGVVQKISTSGQDATRRALSDDEVRALLKVSGTRKAVYLVAVCTGLRRGELESLQWGDVRLDAVRPFLSVRASTTKNGKAATIWLRDDVVAELRKLKPKDVSASVNVFADGVPSMDQFRADLAAAQIAEKDAQGRAVVFHSLRHTLGTNLARAGVAPAVAMQIMRHSDMRLTTRTYTDGAQLPTSDVADKLPVFDVGEQVRAAATGTDDQVVVGSCEKGTQKGTTKLVPACPKLSTADNGSDGGDVQNHSEIPSESAPVALVVASCPDGGKSWGTRIRT